MDVLSENSEKGKREKEKERKGSRDTSTILLPIFLSFSPAAKFKTYDFIVIV